MLAPSSPLIVRLASSQLREPQTVYTKVLAEKKRRSDARRTILFPSNPSNLSHDLESTSKRSIASRINTQPLKLYLNSDKEREKEARPRSRPIGLKREGSGEVRRRHNEQLRRRGWLGSKLAPTRLEQWMRRVDQARWREQRRRGRGICLGLGLAVTSFFDLTKETRERWRWRSRGE